MGRALPSELPEGNTVLSDQQLPVPKLGVRRFSLRQVGPAFWTTACVFSLLVNIILIGLLLGLGRELFALKGMVTDQVIGGLYTNFVKMDDAHITTTILVSDTLQVRDTIPVVFDLPLAQTTEVVLAQDAPVNGATIYLNGAAVPLDLVLKQGTRLTISMNMTVPVNQNVPVLLNVPVHMFVPVDIPLNQTQLHEPFTGLQRVVAPYHSLLASLPQAPKDISVCNGSLSWLCHWYFKDQ